MPLSDYCKPLDNTSWVRHEIAICALGNTSNSSWDSTAKFELVESSSSKAPQSIRSFIDAFGTQISTLQELPSVIGFLVIPFIDAVERLTFVMYKQTHIDDTAHYRLSQIFELHPSLKLSNVVFEKTRLHFAINGLINNERIDDRVYFKSVPGQIITWAHQEGVKLIFTDLELSPEEACAELPPPPPEVDVFIAKPTEATPDVQATPVEATHQPITEKVTIASESPSVSTSVALPAVDELLSGKLLYDCDLSELIQLQDLVNRRVVICHAEFAITSARAFRSPGSWMISQQADMLEMLINHPDVSESAIKQLTELVIALTTVQHD